MTAEESDFQTVAWPTDPRTFTDIEAEDTENEDPTTVMDALPDEGKLTLTEDAFNTNRASKTTGRLYETDEIKILEKPAKETCKVRFFSIPETTRQCKELSAFQIVDAAALYPWRTEDNVIQLGPNPVPETSTQVEPLVGAFKPWESNISWSKV
jgi:hypothetical protein